MAVAALLALAVLALPRRAHPAPPSGPGRVRVGRTRSAPTASEVAGVMVLLAVALRSGCGVVEAVEAVALVHAGDDGPVPDHLRTVAAALRWGVAPQAAWAAADPAWSRVATVLATAARAGIAPSPPLLRAAGDLRASETAAVEVAAARAGVRLVLPLGLAFLPGFVLTTLVPVVLALAGRVLA